MLTCSVAYNLIKRTTVFKCVRNWMKYVHSYGVSLMMYASLNYDQQRLVPIVVNTKYVRCMSFSILFWKLIFCRRFSGVNINNVYPSKNYPIQLMVAGAIGTNGANVHDRVAAVYPFRVVSVIIRRQRTVVHFVWVNEFDIKYATRNCVLKMSLVLGHNNVPCTIMKRSKGSNTSGRRISIVVSELNGFSVSALTVTNKCFICRRSV